MLAALPPESSRGIRSRAMLLLGFGAALRRSELVGLRIEDVQHVPGRAILLVVRRSKTDQHGRGQQIAIWANVADPLLCPAAALEQWLSVRADAADMAASFLAEARDALPLFCGMSEAGRLSGIPLSDKAVARLVKTAAAAAGLDADRYSGHSLRAGLATAAGDQQGAGLADLMRQTRHKSTEVAGRLPPSHRPPAEQCHRAAVCANHKIERMAFRPERSRSCRSPSRLSLGASLMDAIRNGCQRRCNSARVWHVCFGGWPKFKVYGSRS